MTSELDSTTLEPIVRRVLGRPVEIQSWRAVPFSYRATNAVTEGIFRVSGEARDGPDRCAWSLVLKQLRPAYDALLSRFPAEHRRELETAYRWDREALAYASGLFDRLPEGLAAPRAYAIECQADGCRLWLEDLGEERASWDVARYALAARHLGRFNGAYPEGRFQAPWLTRDWIRTWLVVGFGSRAMPIIDNDAIWAHPLVVAAFARDARDRLRRAWADRDRIVARLDARPHTLAHLDAFRRNLIDRGGETVAIDWSYVGSAPLGAEVGHLVIGSVAFAEPQDIRALLPAAVDAYIAGLRDSGWRGDEDAVRIGADLSAVRWVFMLGWMTALLDPVRQASFEKSSGQPLAESIAQAADRTTFLLDAMDRALG